MSETLDLESKLIIPFDFPSIDDEKPQGLLAGLDGTGITAKVGTEISGGSGWPHPITTVHEYGLKVFVDTKANDIPNTVAKTLGAHVFPHVPYLVNMHANAGEDSLAAFLEKRNEVQKDRVAEGTGSLAIAVTVLTSKDKEIATECGRTPLQQVLYYADLAVNAGFDGVVCSPEELEALSGRGKTRDILKVTPGIRPKWAATDDQKRITTPGEAVRLGATHLVIGRPITSPPAEIGSSTNAIEAILQEMAEATA